MRWGARFPVAIVVGANVVTVSRVDIGLEDAVVVRCWMDDEKNEVKSSRLLLSAWRRFTRRTASSTRRTAFKTVAV